MAKRLVVHNDAKLDALEAEAWYDAREPDIGARFVRSLQAVFESIVRAPESFEYAVRDYRRAQLKGIPYAVYFRETADDITVYCIVHHARHPFTWQRRLP